MRPRLILTAAMLMIGAPALGATDKANTSRTAQEGQHQGALVLASSEASRSHGTAQQPAALPRKRVEPRVTTCRCGDPQGQADSDSQDQ